MTEYMKIWVAKALVELGVAVALLAVIAIGYGIVFWVNSRKKRAN